MISIHTKSGILGLMLGCLITYSCTPHDALNAFDQAGKTRKIDAWRVIVSNSGGSSKPIRSVGPMAAPADSSNCELCVAGPLIRAVVDSLTDNDSVEIIRTQRHSYFADEIGFMWIRLNWIKNPYDSSDNFCVIKSVTMYIGTEDESYNTRDTLSSTVYAESPYFLKPCTKISVSRLSNEIYNELLRFVRKTMDDYKLEW